MHVSAVAVVFDAMAQSGVALAGLLPAAGLHHAGFCRRLLLAYTIWIEELGVAHLQQMDRG